MITVHPSLVIYDCPRNQMMMELVRPVITVGVTAATAVVLAEVRVVVAAAAVATSCIRSSNAVYS